MTIALKNTFPDLEQISIVADDEPMAQVFLRLRDDPRICELVERRSNFDGFFTCANIAALTFGERQDSAIVDQVNARA